MRSQKVAFKYSGYRPDCCGNVRQGVTDFAVTTYDPAVFDVRAAQAINIGKLVKPVGLPYELLMAQRAKLHESGRYPESPCSRKDSSDSLGLLEYPARPILWKRMCASAALSLGCIDSPSAESAGAATTRITVMAID